MKPIHAILAATALGFLLTSAGSASAETLYECSGIGVEERAAAETIPHNVRLVFAEPDGTYLGNVETRLTDMEGNEILSVRCPGPWVLLNLADGSYQVTITFKGVTQTRKITPSADRRQKQVFRF